MCHNSTLPCAWFGFPHPQGHATVNLLQQTPISEITQPMPGACPRSDNSSAVNPANPASEFMSLATKLMHFFTNRLHLMSASHLTAWSSTSQVEGSLIVLQLFEIRINKCDPVQVNSVNVTNYIPDEIVSRHVNISTQLVSYAIKKSIYMKFEMWFPTQVLFFFFFVW